MTETHQNFPRLPLMIALVQGCLLFILHQSIEFEFWPATQPGVLYAFYSFTFIVPTLLLLVYQPERLVAFLFRILAFGFLAMLLGYYVGYQTLPTEAVREDTVVFPFLLTLMLASLLALVYLEANAVEEPLTYGWLFAHAWRHSLTLGFSLLFVLLSWGVFILWGALFDAIGIDFFIDTFTEPWFYYPVCALLNGLGIVLFRRQHKIIDTVIHLVYIMMWFLLIPVSFVALLFLATLPFTGLAPLWDSGGSFLILWMQVLILLFANMVYEKGSGDSDAYPGILNRLVLLAILILPLYSAISFYGLTLRIEQYGWTVERCWAVFIWFVVACFSVSYCVSVVLSRQDWFQRARKLNVFFGLGLLVLLLLANSPVLDFRKISVASQLARIEPEQSPADVIDLYYFRYGLARPGYLALQSLKATYEITDPEFALDIDRLYSTELDTLSYDDFQLLLTDYSDGNETVLALIYQNLQESFAWRAVGKSYHLIQVDLTENGQTEYVLFESDGYQVSYTTYRKENGEWLFGDQDSVRRVYGEESTENFIKQLEQQTWTVVKPQWNDLHIGDYVLDFNESND